MSLSLRPGCVHLHNSIHKRKAATAVVVLHRSAQLGHLVLLGPTQAR